MDRITNYCNFTWTDSEILTKNHTKKNAVHIYVEFKVLDMFDQIYKKL
jgi:hypothetical protein